MLVFLWFSLLYTGNLTVKFQKKFYDILCTKVYKEAIPQALTNRSPSGCS
jgi:hypothetical protein